MRRSVILAGGLGALVLAGAAALAVGPWREPDPAVRLDSTDTALVSLGAQVYAAQCAACHGANLEGEPDWRTRKPDGLLPAPPHDETGHTWHHPDEVLFALTKHGLPKEIGGRPYFSAMPAYDGILTDREILAVLSYIKSRWPSEVIARHDAISEVARK